MRILYIDIDCLRPDHLGCFGYHRDTSPHIDRLAARGLRFDNVYASDTPCLPSRTALFSGRFGIRTGAIGHGGTAADVFIDGPERGFNTRLARTNWMRALRQLGLTTATISPFAERHGAYHFYANFNEVHNTGRRGLENADEIGAAALSWLEHNATRDDWFLHVNLWDPHTPYRVPLAYGEPFADAPLPAWYTEAIRAEHFLRPGPHSAAEPNGFDRDDHIYRPAYPRHPLVIDSMAAARQMFDGYDTGVRFADEWVGRILDVLRERGIHDDCVILVSADHGENLGELGIYGDHHTADQHTARVPVILCWPGVTDARAGQLESGLYYQFDIAASLIELAGGRVPDGWDGESFAQAWRAGRPAGRDALILSQGAWTCQRAVRMRAGGAELLGIRTYHDGYHAWPDFMLFDLARDPHEQHDIAAERPDLIERAQALLESWHARMMQRASHPVDPMWTVLREGGPYHTRGHLPAYLERLEATGRTAAAATLRERHARDLAGRDV